MNEIFQAHRNVERTMNRVYDGIVHGFGVCCFESDAKREMRNWSEWE